MKKIIFGIHAIQALLNHNPKCFQEVFVRTGEYNRRLQSLVSSLIMHGIIIKNVNRNWLDNQVKCNVHQGIIAFIKIIKSYQETDLLNLLEVLEQPFLLILDGITDPHNLGACLRTADALGVHAVIIPKNNSAQLNATVKKVACGAAETIPLIRVTNLVRTIRILKKNNIYIIGTADNAPYVLDDNSHLPKAVALIMGSEGQGIRRLTREHCDKIIKIPLKGNVSSLNVSVATGIFLFEFMKKRIKNI